MNYVSLNLIFENNVQLGFVIDRADAELFGKQFGRGEAPQHLHSDMVKCFRPDVPWSVKTETLLFATAAPVTPEQQMHMNQHQQAARPGSHVAYPPLGGVK